MKEIILVFDKDGNVINPKKKSVIDKIIESGYRTIDDFVSQVSKEVSNYSINIDFDSEDKVQPLKVKLIKK